MFKAFKHDCKEHPIRILGRLFSRCRALVFPRQCLNCRAFIDPEAVETGVFSAWFCDTCLAKGASPFKPPFCDSCGHLFATGENHLCETCIKDPSPIRRVRAVFVYQDLIRQALPLFKYHAKLGLAEAFSPLMYAAFEQYFSESGIQAILPVPLHPKKLRKRGFNQSYLLVRGFEKRWETAHGTGPDWNLDIKSLERVRHTHPQTGFDLAERRKNLKNAFRVRHPESIKGRHVLLVDDVYTTGTTCREAAKELRAKGALQVDALVLARA